MRFGDIEAGQGQKVFGFLSATETHGRFAAHVPLHVIEGASDGPILVVQAGVSGLEIEPALVLPRIVTELDPTAIAGTLVVVPLLNTSGFEFEQVNAAWDDMNLNTLGRGRADGTISERLIYTYYQKVIAQSDALVDIHTGAQWGYYRYAGVYEAGDIDIEASRRLAIALGLPQVLLGQPEDHSMAYEAALDGKTVVSAWIGGGPGLRDHRAEDMARVRAVVRNAMVHLGMIPGVLQQERPISVIKAHSFVRDTPERGLTFMSKEKRGTLVEAGESIGYVRHPFTGDVVYDIVAPREGTLLHAGAQWPLLPEGELLAILGDIVEEIGAGP